MGDDTAGLCGAPTASVLPNIAKELPKRNRLIAASFDGGSMMRASTPEELLKSRTDPRCRAVRPFTVAVVNGSPAATMVPLVAITEPKPESVMGVGRVWKNRFTVGANCA